MSDLDRLIAGELPDLIRVRHDLHAHPQLGYQETYASELVQRELGRAGVPFAAGLAETGVVGWVEPEADAGGSAAVGLRADFDALPIREATGLSYASTHPGLMHACGHDGHTTILLGAARILRKLRGRLPRPVKLFFQPAEEFGAGAQRLIDAGALTEAVGGRRVDVMFGLHGTPHLRVGQVATKAGALLAGGTDFELVVTGRGGHGAMPQFAADPVVAAAQIVLAAQTIVSRNCDPTQPAVLSVCGVHGGEAVNVIPESVRLFGTVRTHYEDNLKRVLGRLDELAVLTARAMGCRAELKLLPAYPPVHNDAKATAFAADVARAAVGDGSVYLMEVPAMASEDFAFYGKVVPSCFSFVGVCPPGRAEYPPLHSPFFDFTDDALAVGLKLMLGYALGGGRLAA